eukprot:TRINITY_DN11788_c0_g1_i1.p2 TRINITY_DN11788_c0_g1~~TRINITY_DN11788_c0_g1_i1.p2  ORF type:complete len:451 (+),score=227.14 TRINITY_DN11788_c0_g1_i1:86-1354(+)
MLSRSAQKAARAFAPAARSAFARAQQRNLSIHEYQAKQLMRDNGVCVEEGYYCDDLKKVAGICDTLKSSRKVVKSQILAGGRGMGTFDTGFKGGVHVAKNTDEAVDIAGKMLGNKLITKQTPTGGVRVQKLFITEAVDIKRELYLAMMLDRGSGGPVIIGSTQGGMAIEEVAAKDPSAIKKLPVQVKEGLQHAAAEDFAKQLEFTGDQAKQAADQIVKLYNLMRKYDATQVEINPMVELTDGRVMMIDAKLGFDDNAEFRQKEIFALQDEAETDAREAEAAKWDLNYIALDGNVGCLVNGAGLAMATMDTISLYGGTPANFLDVGGTADKNRVVAALKIVTSDDKVKGILVNIFGGIVDCAMIGQGVVDAVKEVGLEMPLVCRLSGNNADKGKEILKASGVNIIPADDLDDGCKKIMAAVGK